MTSCPNPVGRAFVPHPAAEPAARAMEAIAKKQGYLPTSLLLNASDGTAVLGSEEPSKANFLTALMQFTAGSTLALGAGEFLLLTFTGHGTRGPQPSSTGQDSGWVFSDEVLFDVELESALNQLASGVRVLVVSEACHSGTIVASGTIADRTKQVIRPNQKPSIIQISAAYDYEHAHVVGGLGVFAQSLETVWNGGAFSGGHEEFTEEIRTVMRTRFDASGEGIWWQEPRYLRVGTKPAELLAFDRLRPFTITPASR